MAVPVPRGRAASVAPPSQGLGQLLLEQLLDEAADPLPQPRLIGSNQASPASNGVALTSVVLFPSMAWSPPACRRRSWLVEQAGDYATLISNHIRDGTSLKAYRI